LNLYDAFKGDPIGFTDCTGMASDPSQRWANQFLNDVGSADTLNQSGFMSQEATQAAKDRLLTGIVYVIEGYDTDGSYQRYVGSTIKQLQERINKKHPCNLAGLFKDERTKIKVRKVYARPDISKSGRQTLRSALNETMRAAEQGTSQELGIIPNQEGVLNKNNPAVQSNMEKWNSAHSSPWLNPTYPLDSVTDWR
jgi:hypothetical protein